MTQIMDFYSLILVHTVEFRIRQFLKFLFMETTSKL